MLDRLGHGFMFSERALAQITSNGGNDPGITLDRLTTWGWICLPLVLLVITVWTLQPHHKEVS